MWVCPNCKTQPTRLQEVHYGHIENEKWVEDEVTDLACVYCHAVYQKRDLVETAKESVAPRRKSPVADT